MKSDKNPDWMRLYELVCEQIEQTDKTSFRLLAAVPLAAAVGSGVLTLIEPKPSSVGGALVALSLVGLLITVGLFRWELRNIQKCNWLISRAALIEKKLWPKQIFHIQYAGYNKSNTRMNKLSDIQNSKILFSDEKWGKTQAVKLVFLAATLAWLAPIIFAVQSIIDEFSSCLSLS